MKKVEIKKGITNENIYQVIDWTNTRGEMFLRQWAGELWSFPLQQQQILAEADTIYSVFEAEKFLGMLQIIRIEEKNAHIGRFVLNPEETGKGIGAAALQQLCEFLFQKYTVNSITLNVFAFNEAARKCYQKCGFRVLEEFIYDEKTCYKMILQKAC